MHRCQWWGLTRYTLDSFCRAAISQRRIAPDQEAATSQSPLTAVDNRPFPHFPLSALRDTFAHLHYIVG